MRPLFSTSTPKPTLGLFVAAGENALHASVLLRDLLDDYPARADLAASVADCEREGDRLTHAIVRELTTSGGSPRLPRADGHRLATAIDDIVDDAEQAADQLGVYGVEATMEQAVGLAEALVGASTHVLAALQAWRDGTDLTAALREVHRFEHEGDRLLREAMISLFAGGIDPMVVIRWKDIFASIESSIDACETVAHLLEGITLSERI